MTAFECRRPDDDPEWIRYFDEAELSAELGHCFRDLGRADAASDYAVRSLGPHTKCSPRSRFFAQMVLATARLDAGELEEACTVAREAIDLGEQLESARALTYVSTFRIRLDATAASRPARDFLEDVAESRLWRQAA